MARIAPLILFLALPLIAYGQLYKWVDKDGKVQYSDRPPPADAREEKKLGIRTPPPPPAPAKPAAKDQKSEAKPEGPKTVAEQEAEFRKRRAKQEEEETKQAQEAKQRQERCVEARNRLRGMEESPRIINYDTRGERVVADDATRAKMVQEAQQDVDKWCK